jgi:hypothetical protein
VRLIVSKMKRCQSPEIHGIAMRHSVDGRQEGLILTARARGGGQRVMCGAVVALRLLIMLRRGLLWSEAAERH